jgi:hypothetical protein
LSRRSKSKLHGFNLVSWYVLVFLSGIGLNLTILSTVTREKIPTKTIQSWNFPKANDDSTDEDEGAESSFGVNEATAGPSNPQAYNLRRRSGDGVKDEDTISISSDSSMLLLKYAEDLLPTFF